MPKYLIEAAYTAEGLAGLKKDNASGRRQAVTSAIEGLGGKLEAMYYVLGDVDTIVVADLPDATAAAALALAGSGSGLLRTKTTALLSVEEADAALSKTVQFKAPGR